MFRGRPEGKSEGLLFNADYSLKDLENSWYAFRFGFFVVPFFFKASLLKTCCLVLPGAWGKAWARQGCGTSPEAWDKECSPDRDAGVYHCLCGLKKTNIFV